MDQYQKFEPYVRNKRELSLPFQTCNYSIQEERDTTFPHMKDINKTEYHKLSNALAFVIRSNNDDDIHKSIKYQIWASGKENNDKLNEAFNQAQKQGIEVFLFYSVVKSGQFVGVAKLLSGYQEESFPFWWQSKKWKGHFKVQWIQAKDVINKNFENLKNRDLVEVTRSRDGAQVEWATAQQMLKIFEEQDPANSILNDFKMLDEREKQLRDHKYYPQQPQQRYHPSAYYPQYYAPQPYYYYQFQQQQPPQTQYQQ